MLTDDAERATRSVMNFLWTTFTRFEPAADIHAAAARIVRNHIAYEPPVVIDARMKPWYPGEVTCRDDIARRVTDALARVLLRRDLSKWVMRSAGISTDIQRSTANSPRSSHGPRYDGQRSTVRFTGLDVTVDRGPSTVRP